MLQRFTTEYIEHEDRLHVRGQLADGTMSQLWLSRRLLLRVLPYLVGWLERGAGPGAFAELTQSFAQQAAASGMETLPPVQSVNRDAAWVAHAVDFTAGDDGVALAFRPLDPAVQPAPLCLDLSAMTLRQWLTILHQQCERAEWSLPWPAWMTGTTPVETGSQIVLH